MDKKWISMICHLKEVHLKSNIIDRWKLERRKKDMSCKKLLQKVGVIILKSDKVDSGQINLLKTRKDFM